MLCSKQADVTNDEHEYDNLFIQGMYKITTLARAAKKLQLWIYSFCRIRLQMKILTIICPNFCTPDTLTWIFDNIMGLSGQQTSSMMLTFK